MRAKTTYFADTTLLLAGGGFGASAFAGAYLAAESRGCRFHAVAATSSGAIVAALIASGCRGRELVKAMRAMSRAGLMGHDPVPYDTGGERRIESAQLSSENIQHWLDDRLRAKLGVDRPVIFADLPRLLIIMALDLRRGTSKIWSRATDPTMPVALAVRCACSDPFRFAPVEHDGQLFADGNVVGGLSFLEIDHSAFEQSAYLPALLLRLSPPTFRDLGQDIDATQLPRRVGDIALSRSPAMLPRPGFACQEIAIPAAGPPAESISSPAAPRDAVRAGYQAAADYFDGEKTRAIESGYVARRLESGHHAHLVDQIMIAIGSARRSIFISGGDLSWARELFPLLARKAIEGIPIRILNGKTIDPVLSTILGGIGCENRRTAGDLLTYGAFIDAHEPDGSAVLIKLLNGKLRGGALLGAQDVPGVVTALMERLELIWEAAAPQNIVARPEFDTVAWRSVEEALRACVAPYRDAVFSPASVAVKDLLPLATCLHVAKLRRAEAVVDLYRGREQPLFVPMRLRGGAWFLPPPVIEVVDGRLVVVDGEHRVVHCQRHRIATIQAMVVHGTEPLPARIGRDWHTILPLPIALTREQRYDGYERSRWRDLRGAWTVIAHQSLPDKPSAQAVRYPSRLPQS